MAVLDPFASFICIGSGFIGRHLVEHLITNELVAEIRVVDKTPPQMAWMNQEHSKVFSNPLVEFCSANLINQSELPFVVAAICFRCLLVRLR